MNIQEESGVNDKHSDDINQGLNCEKGYQLMRGKRVNHVEGLIY